jgi:hypothetical protein
MPRPTLAEFAVNIALEEARRGVFESDNNNRGERVDEYQTTASGVLGEAWCVKFVYWCYEQAAGRLGVKNPMPKIFGAAQFEAWATRERRLVTSPIAGDVLIKEHRHAGLVTGAPLPAGTVPSVEGNTWANSDFAHRREGVYVLKNERVLKCSFVRVA